jgi:hypothetical protein
MTDNQNNTRRYKDTLRYLDGGQVRLGLFKVPPEFVSQDIGTWKRITVSSGDVGRWDNIAVRLYGPGMESMWWAILYVNGIVNPEREVYPGVSLAVPPVEVVDAFLSRQ